MANDKNIIPGNSLKSREASEKPKTTKVIKGKAELKKKSAGRQLLNSFISEDAGNVKDYIIGDVIVPAVKDVIQDVVTNSISMLLFGDTRGGNKRNNPSGSYVSYNNRYFGGSKPRAAASSSNNFNIDDIFFETRMDAEEALDNLVEMIDRYGSVTVLELYDSVGLQCPPYTSDKYGWTRLGNAAVRRTRDGYILELPRPKYLD